MRRATRGPGRTCRSAVAGKGGAGTCLAGSRCGPCPGGPVGGGSRSPARRRRSWAGSRRPPVSRTATRSPASAAARTRGRPTDCVDRPRRARSPMSQRRPRLRAPAARGLRAAGCDGARRRSTAVRSKSRTPAALRSAAPRSEGGRSCERPSPMGTVHPRGTRDRAAGEIPLRALALCVRGALKARAARGPPVDASSRPRRGALRTGRIGKPAHPAGSPRRRRCSSSSPAGTARTSATRGSPPPAPADASHRSAQNDFVSRCRIGRPSGSSTTR
jgi:hypothetical protein